MLMVSFKSVGVWTTVDFSKILCLFPTTAKSEKNRERKKRKTFLSDFDTKILVERSEDGHKTNKVEETQKQLSSSSQRGERERPHK